MRCCANCRAVQQAFVHEEASKQLLCNYLWIKHSVQSMHDAGRCAGTKTGNLQLAADSATSFTSLYRFFRHTCINQLRVVTHTWQVMFSIAPHEVPLFQLISTLLIFQRRSGPVTVLVRTYHYQNQNFHDNQSTCWATHFHLLS